MEIVVILICLTIAKACWNQILSNPLHSDGNTSSIAKSKSKRVFVAAVSITPQVILWKSTKLTIEEGWIERQVKSTYPLVWIPTLKPFPDYYLCFSVGQDGGGTGNSDLLFELHGQEGRSFSWATWDHRIIFSTEIDPATFAKGTAQMHVLSTPNDTQNPAFQLSWQPK